MRSVNMMDATPTVSRSSSRQYPQLLPARLVDLCSIVPSALRGACSIAFKKDRRQETPVVSASGEAEEIEVKVRADVCRTPMASIVMFQKALAVVFPDLPSAAMARLAEAPVGVPGKGETSEDVVAAKTKDDLRLVEGQGRRPGSWMPKWSTTSAPKRTAPHHKTEKPSRLQLRPLRTTPWPTTTSI